MFLIQLCFVVFTLNSAPLNEGFEGVFPPDGWQVISNNAANNVTQNNDQAHSGTYSARFSSYYSAADYTQYIISPKLSVTSGDDTFEFWYRKYTSGTEVFSVGVSTTDSDPASFVFGGDISDASTTWQQHIEDLSAHDGNSVYVAIRYTSNFQYYLYVDDVVGPEIYVAPYGVDLQPEKQISVGEVEDNVKSVIWTFNTGPNNDNYTFSIFGNTWAVDLPESTGTLAPGDSVLDTVSVTIPSSFAGSADTVYVIATSVNAPTVVDTVEIITLIATFYTLPFEENFDAPGFSTFINAAGNDVDWVKNDSIFHSADSAAYNDYGVYNENIFVIDGFFDFTAAVYPVLTFWHIAKTEGGFDDCYVEITEDAGVTWAAIPENQYYGKGDYAGELFDEDSYTDWGTTDIVPEQSWYKFELFDLTACAGQNDIAIRFRLTSDSGIQRYGWLIDDIQLYEGIPYALNVEEDLSGTSDFGLDIRYPITLFNNGFREDAYDISVEGNAFATFVTYPESTFALDSTDSVAGEDSMELEVVVEPGEPGLVDTALIIFTSKSDLSIKDTVTIITLANAYLVINEIMYNPQESGSDTTEFIEIYNISGATAHLTGWQVTDGEGTCTFQAGTQIPNGFFGVLATDTTELKNLTENADNIGDGDDVFLDNFAPSLILSNTSDEVILLNPLGEVVDTVHYDDDWGADGDGNSLELISAALDNNNPASWMVSYDTCGTPGDSNSVSSFIDIALIGFYMTHPGPVVLVDSTVNFNFILENMGSLPADTFTVKDTIYGEFTEAIEFIETLDPGEIDTFQLSGWVPAHASMETLNAWVNNVHDINPGNDALGLFDFELFYSYDIANVELGVSQAYGGIGTQFEISAKFVKNGYFDGDSFNVKYIVGIDTVTERFEYDTTDAEDTIFIVFDSMWVASAIGYYQVYVINEWLLDEVAENDTGWVGINIYPLYESFETAVPPADWIEFHFAGNGWTQSSWGGPHWGDEHAYGDGDAESWLVTPELGISTGDSFRFWYAVESASYDMSFYLRINTGNNPNDTAAYIIIWDSGIFNNTDYIYQAVDLSAYDGQSAYLAFNQYYGEATYYGMLLDDVAGPNLYVAPYGVDLYPETNTEYGNYGDTLMLLFFVQNTGTNPDSFDFYLLDADWAAWILDSLSLLTTATNTMAPAAVGSFYCAVEVDPAATTGEAETLWVQAVSSNDPSVVDTIRIVIIVGCYGIYTFEYGFGADVSHTNGDATYPWVNSNGTGSGTDPGAPHSGDSCAYFNSYTNSLGDLDTMFLWSCDLTDAINPQLSFWWWYGGAGELNVLIDNGFGFALLGGPYSSSTVWTEEVIDLSTYIGLSDVVIAFEGISDWGSYSMFVDDVRICEAPVHDIGAEMVDINDSPDSFFIMGNSYFPQVQVINFGTITEDSFEVTLQNTDGSYYTLERFDSTIAPKETLFVQYATPWVPDTIGQFLFNGWTSLFGLDSDHSNDTVDGYYSFYSYPSDEYIAQSFEDTSFGDWYASDNWHLDILGLFHGVVSVYCDSTADDDSLISPRLDLSRSALNCFSFWYYELGLDNDDTTFVMISIDGGVTYTPIDTLCGTDGSWDFVFIDLSAYSGNDNVYLMFHRLDSGAKAGSQTPRFDNIIHPSVYQAEDLVANAVWVTDSIIIVDSIYTICLELYNDGGLEVDTFAVLWEVNDGFTQTDTYSIALASGDTDTVCVSVDWIPISAGNRTITATIQFDGDVDLRNNEVFTGVNVKANYDLDPTDVPLPPIEVELYKYQQVSVEVCSKGLYYPDTSIFTYMIGGVTVTETLEVDFSGGDTIIVNFVQRWLPTVVGWDTITVIAQLVSDDNRANDTINAPLRVYGFIEDFELGVMPPDWTVINNDGDGYEWIVFDDVTIAYTDQYFARIHWNAAGNDDWLITPSVVVATGDSFIFWARPFGTFFHEDFNVLVSTTGNTVPDFTDEIGSEVQIPFDYHRYAYDLSTYIGDTIYIAIQCVSVDEFYLVVDHILGPRILRINHDYQANSFVNFPPIMYFDSTYGIAAEIENVGAYAEVDVPVELTLTGTPVDSFFMSLEIAEIDIGVNTITAPGELSFDLFSVQTLLDTDDDNSNDTIFTFAGYYPDSYLLQSFETGVFPPGNWTVFNRGDDNLGVTWDDINLPDMAHSGDFVTFVDDGAIGEYQKEWLVTPQLDLTATPDTDVVSFWLQTEPAFSGTLFVLLSTTSRSVSSFTETLAVIGESAEPSFWWLSLAPYNDELVYIAFVYAGTNAGYLGIDDIIHPPLFRFDYMVDFIPASQEGRGICGDTVWYSLVISNEGLNDDSYTLSLTGNSWESHIYLDGVEVTNTGIILSCSDTLLDIAVIIPGGECQPDSDMVTIIATSDGYPRTEARASITTYSGCYFIESFESETFPPTGWIWQEEFYDGTGTSPIWSQETFGAGGPTCDPYHGSFMANFNSYSCSRRDKASLQTPRVDLSSAPYSPQLTFWMYYAYLSGYDDTLKVIGSKNGGTTFDDTLGSYVVSDKGTGNNGWYKNQITLSEDYVGVSNVRFKFLGISDFGYDINIDLVKLCLPPEHDIAALELMPGAGGSICIGIPDFFIDIVIQNFGGLSETLFTINLEVSDGFTAMDTIRVTIEPGEIDTFTFSDPWIIDSLGTINFVAWTELTGDAEPANDTTTDSIYVLPAPTPVSYCNDFDEAESTFYESGDGWERGTPTLVGPVSAHTPPNCWATVLDDLYPNYAEFRLYSPVIDLRGFVSSKLMFYHWYETESYYDGGNVKVTSDFGVTWTLIVPEGGYPDPDVSALDDVNLNEPGYSGASAGWVEAIFDLSAFSDELIIIEWLFMSDISNVDPGWYIDDVCILVPELVINEIMKNPSEVIDVNGEWFEIYNNGLLPVDINGWVIHDLDFDQDTITSVTPVIIHPDSYFILGVNGDPGTNGGVTVDYVYDGSDFTLGNADDEIYLENTLGTVIDFVEYDDGITFPDPEGASMELIHPDLDNNIGYNWIAGSETYGDGDLGTPGEPNSRNPRIAVFPDSIDFANVVLADTSDSFITVCNVGTDTLIIHYYTLTDDSNFTVVWTQETDTLLPGKCDTVWIFFHPDTTGLMTSLFPITSNDPNDEDDSIGVFLHGNGIIGHPVDIYKVPPHTVGAIIVNGHHYLGVSELHLLVDEGVVLNIGVTSPNGTAEERWYFTGWSDGGAQNHDIGPITSAYACSSFFDVRYRTTIIKDPYQDFGFIMVDSTWYNNTGFLEFWWPPHTEHFLEVSDPDTGGGINLDFINWTIIPGDDTLSDSVWVTVNNLDSAATITANYTSSAEVSCSLGLNTEWDIDSVNLCETITMQDFERIELNNNGDVTIAFGICISRSDDLLPGIYPDYNRFSLRAQFTDSAVPPVGFLPYNDLVKIETEWATDIIFGPGGYSVDPDTHENLWMQFIAPTNGNIFTSQELAITLFYKIVLP
ncbi:choice-of-anchor J domain-containing protein [bacterium]|nr:choice-of-anchor J domain-containing protein [bacterium]